MTNNRGYSIAEICALSDRLLGRSVSITLKDQPELQRDLHAAGSLLAYLVLEGVIKEKIIMPGRGEMKTEG